MNSWCEFPGSKIFIFRDDFISLWIRCANIHTTVRDCRNHLPAHLHLIKNKRERCSMPHSFKNWINFLQSRPFLNFQVLQSSVTNSNIVLKNPKGYCIPSRVSNYTQVFHKIYNWGLDITTFRLDSPINTSCSEVNTKWNWT